MPEQKPITCQLCHSRPASIVITTSINNVNKVLNVCEVCAREKNLMFIPPQILNNLQNQPLPPFIDSLLKQFSQPSFDRIFEMFSEHARRVVYLSQEEAKRLGFKVIDTGHLLLGLVKEEGAAYRLLQQLGVDIVAFFSELEFAIGRGDESGEEDNSELKLSPRA